MSNNRGFKIINQPKEASATSGPFAGVIRDAEVKKLSDDGAVGGADSFFGNTNTNADTNTNANSDFKISDNDRGDYKHSNNGNDNNNDYRNNNNEEPEDSERKKSMLWNTIGIVAIALLLFGIGKSVANNDGIEVSEKTLEEQLASIAANSDGEVSDLTVELVNGDGETSIQNNAQASTQNNAQASVSTGGQAVSTSPSSQASGSTDKVTIALLAPSGFEGKVRGCDVVVYRQHDILPTRYPLNSILREMFAGHIATDYSPGNFLATEGGLQFTGATLNGRTARVNLSGQISDDGDGCNSDRVFIQIEETALQFSTIDNVEIYLNGTRMQSGS